MESESALGQAYRVACASRLRHRLSCVGSFCGRVRSLQERLIQWQAAQHVQDFLLPGTAMPTRKPLQLLCSMGTKFAADPSTSSDYVSDESDRGKNVCHTLNFCSMDLVFSHVLLSKVWNAE